MNKSLISLDRFNELKSKSYQNEKKTGNNIACPKCGEELYDTNRSILLESDVPKTAVACTKCNYSGFRVS